MEVCSSIPAPPSTMPQFLTPFGQFPIAFLDSNYQVDSCAFHAKLWSLHYSIRIYRVQLGLSMPKTRYARLALASTTVTWKFGKIANIYRHTVKRPESIYTFDFVGDYIVI